MNLRERMQERSWSRRERGRGGNDVNTILDMKISKIYNLNNNKNKEQDQTFPNSYCIGLQENSCLSLSQWDPGKGNLHNTKILPAENPWPHFQRCQIRQEV